MLQLFLKGCKYCSLKLQMGCNLCSPFPNNCSHNISSCWNCVEFVLNLCWDSYCFFIIFDQFIINLCGTCVEISYWFLRIFFYNNLYLSPRWWFVIVLIYVLELSDLYWTSNCLIYLNFVFVQLIVLIDLTIISTSYL